MVYCECALKGFSFVVDLFRRLWSSGSTLFAILFLNDKLLYALTSLQLMELMSMLLSSIYTASLLSKFVRSSIPSSVTNILPFDAPLSPVNIHVVQSFCQWVVWVDKMIRRLGHTCQSLPSRRHLLLFFGRLSRLLHQLEVGSTSCQVLLGRKSNLRPQTFLSWINGSGRYGFIM